MKIGSIASMFVCLIGVVHGGAFAEGSEGDLIKVLSGMKGFLIARNDTFTSNYAQTQCVNISFRNSSGKAGLVCKSRDRRFFEDMGIATFDSLPQTGRPQVRPVTGLVVATPMAQYGMSPLAGAKVGVAAANVDCDTRAGAVYRATATCSVAVTSLSNEEVLYTNVVVKRHTDKRSGLTAEQILEIWRRLERR